LSQVPKRSIVHQGNYSLMIAVKRISSFEEGFQDPWDIIEAKDFHFNIVNVHKLCKYVFSDSTSLITIIRFVPAIGNNKLYLQTTKVIYSLINSLSILNFLIDAQIDINILICHSRKFACFICNSINIYIIKRIPSVNIILVLN